MKIDTTLSDVGNLKKLIWENYPSLDYSEVVSMRLKNFRDNPGYNPNLDNNITKENVSELSGSNPDKMFDVYVPKNYTEVKLATLKYKRINLDVVQRLGIIPPFDSSVIDSNEKIIRYIKHHFPCIIGNENNSQQYNLSLSTYSSYGYIIIDSNSTSYLYKGRCRVNGYAKYNNVYMGSLIRGVQ